MNVEKMAIARKYLISGMVQGVGYRFFAEREAKSLGLRGYVKNLPDGRVEAYAIGDERALKKFGRRLAEGPGSALVKRVEEADDPVDERYIGFGIEW
ncbi:MAG: acylphosphatase [Terriglobia bacterium]